MTASPVSKPSYIPSLDGIRALSIILVFFSHLGFSGKIPGGFGVTVFFFLSGFLITTLLAREQDRYGSITLKAFYLRRVARLGPPLLATLTAATLLVVLGLAQGDLNIPVYLSQIFFYYNYYSLTTSATSVVGLNILWSLSIEEHFYLIWPAMFIAISRGRLGVRGIVLLLVLILAWRAVRFYGFGDGEWKIYVSTDTRLDSLLYGCLLALLVWRGQAERLFPSAPVARGLVLIGAFALLLASFVIGDEGFRSTLRYSIQGIALLPLFYYSVFHSTDLIFRPLNWSPLRRIGVWSYTLYLCHLVIIRMLEHNGFAPGSLQLVILSAGLSCLFAAAVHEWLEKPSKHWRVQLVGH